MSVAAKVSVKIIRVLHTLINAIILTIILITLIFGCYAMWDSSQLHSTASRSTYEKYKPSAESDFVSFETLQSINHEVIAWLTVYGTNIDYPMTQGEDNMKYVNISAEGKHSLAGAIFADYRNSKTFTDFNTIIYGHHMDSDAMFSEISKFSDRAYFDDHRYGKLFVNGQDLGIEFFAFIRADENDRQVFNPNITDPALKQEYLNLLTEKAINRRTQPAIGVDDRIVLLSTCSPNTTSGRDILVGVLTNYVPVNTFESNQTETLKIIPAIDKLTTFINQAPLWMKIVTLLSAAATIALIAILIHEKSTKRKYLQH